MSSFAFSLAKFCTPKKLNTCSSSSSRLVLLKNLDTPELQLRLNNADVLPTAPLLQANHENPNLLGRREAIAAAGVSLSVGMLGLFLMQPQIAAADEGSPCEFTVSPSGLAFCDKVVGVGTQPAAGQLIKAHYVGKLQNGKVFDSSYGRGRPLTFRVGVGEVIKGWDQGILGTDGVPPMLAGGKRTLRIPPELGYGMRGAGCRRGTCIIPPDSVLFFDVEFIGKA